MSEGLLSANRLRDVSVVVWISLPDVWRVPPSVWAACHRSLLQCLTSVVHGWEVACSDVSMRLRPYHTESTCISATHRPAATVDWRTCNLAVTKHRIWPAAH